MAILISVFAGFSQSNIYIRGDSIYLQRTGGNSELILLNGTRDSAGGVLYNKGAGRTGFRKSKALNDSTFTVGGDTIVIRGIGGGTNVANASLTADDDYAHNWAQHILKFDSTKYVEFNSYRPDPLLPDNIFRSYFYMDSTVNGFPYRFNFALRNAANDGDSIKGDFGTNDNTTFIYNSGDNGNQFGNWDFIGNSSNPRLNGTLSSVGKSSAYTFGHVATINPNDSIRMKLESVADADYLVGARAESSGLWTPVRIPKPSGADSIIYSTNYRRDTAIANVRTEIANTVAGVHTFFKVGEATYPVNGDSIYTNSLLAGYQHYIVSREGISQYMDTEDGFEVDTSAGIIYVHPPFVTNERIQIIADKLLPLRSQSFALFNINTIPNLRAWFDATDVATVTIATGVSQWDDKTSNNNDLTSGTGANQPAYFSSGGSNNKAYLQFNSTDDLFKAFSTPDSGAVTVYMVMKQTAFTTQGITYSFGSLNGADGLMPSANTDLLGVYWGLSNYDGNFQNGANANTGTGEWQLVKAVFRGNNDNYVIKNLQGGMQYDNSPETIGAGTPSVLKNDWILFQYFSNPWQLSEAVIVKGEPSSINDNSIKSYLIGKYLIPQRKLALMYGDSHFAGLMSGTPLGRQCYQTATKDKNYDVMNEGVSGSAVLALGVVGGATGKNLEDLYNDYDAYVVPNSPVVIFQYGTNDGANPSNPVWVASYKNSIQHFLDLGVPASKIIICTAPYTTNPSYPNLAASVPVISGIATDMGIQFCDFYTYMQGLSLDCYTVSGGDGIHGNGTIHDAMATLLKTFLP